MHPSGSGGSGSKYAWLSWFKLVWSHQDSKSIFVFLMLNATFAVIQFVYGYFSNSLGLLADAFHMVFDCIALVIGLLSSVLSKRRPDTFFTFGYNGFESLAAFVNSTILLMMSIGIMSHAIGRLWEEPKLELDMVFEVAVGGFVVNLVGLLFFHDHRHHSDGHLGCSHGTPGAVLRADNGNPAGGVSCGGSMPRGRDKNLWAVFLHVLADTLGSLALVFSTLVVRWTGWAGWDTWSSMAVSCLIAWSAYYVFADSARTLAGDEVRSVDILEKKLSRGLTDTSLQNGTFQVLECKVRLPPDAREPFALIRIMVSGDHLVSAARSAARQRAREAFCGSRVELYCSVEVAGQ